jgi:hypothetical protein
MRKTLVLLALFALGLPVVATGASRANDGTLSVENGRGKVTVKARGGLIGRINRGTVTIFDLTPRDANVPVVSGDDQPVIAIGVNGLRYRGTGVRFRVLGGGFRVVVDGRGIDLSVVGRGDGFLEGNGLDPGLYSLDGSDCRKQPETCDLLPQPGVRFKLGGLEQGGENTAPSRGEPAPPRRP